MQYVRDVAETTWHATYEGIIPYSMQQSLLERAYHDTRLKLRMERSHFLVADTSNGIIGFANFSPLRNDGKAELGAIYIYPAFQGIGIGSALLQKGLEVLGDVTEIYVHIEKANQAGMNFYESKGFENVKMLKELSGRHAIERVRLVLKLEVES